ncbi:superoxide dismutase [Alphaproteobacteria bacterium]|jgi:Fe-Mn family superoxide dismutase|nr:superoxide dismutase [Alphaproteobacteria bacterium]MDB2371052.1 superoxide dismutase [Alphaproteobacteria bacterium]|tara:strand:- start:2091 stop:2684 length:594 start_codon:yes stop_codon:yes gene_type:complete
MSFELPSLSYANDALAPYMSAETLDFHHGKHHQTYVTNLNNLLKDNELQGASLEDIVIKSSKDASMAGIFNNAGQHWNHILFWQCMKPNGGGSIPSELETRLNSDFGSIDQFKEAFIQAGTTQFGSGWAWLAIDNGKLVVTKSANASNPLVDGMKPILGCDVWEHSYYIDYRNKRPDYLKAFLDSLVNWEFVASQLD